MLLSIPDVLTQEQVAEARALLEAAEWVDGRITAGHQGSRVKMNEQLPPDSETGARIGGMILEALASNPLFRSAALPLFIVPPLFNRYAGGQTFGTHVDGAVRSLPNGQRIRTDLSCTLFFSGPDEYDGGELTIEDTYGCKTVKLPPGHMILYPSTSLHQVTPITRGTRLCSFFWIQSMVREDSRRSILFDMDIAIQRLSVDNALHPSVVALTGAYHNLLREWVNL